MTNADACRAIIHDFAQGEMRLTDCLRKYGLNSGRFYELVTTVPSLGADYARAREIRAELVADEIIGIADNETDSSKAKNRIDARKWIASKLYPRTYGERLDVNVAQTLDVNVALTEAKSRLSRPARDLLDVQDVQVLDLPAISGGRHTDAQSVGSADAQAHAVNPFDD